ncbi:MAG: hypothetical protein M3Y67_08455, partial [Pseudomonadota bacterium]|nr:hypothetical protein [Pseudomonadota bacterium]
LESTLARIKAYRLADPKFESAIAAFAAAEAGHREDPAQGTVFVASSAEPGPAQSMVQDLLRG